MLVRSFFPVLLLATCIFGGPLVERNPHCNLSNQQCCSNAVEPTEAHQDLFKLIGLEATGLLGLNCLPILGAAACEQTAYCCSNNQYNGLINMGCSKMPLDGI